VCQFPLRFSASRIEERAVTNKTRTGCLLAVLAVGSAGCGSSSPTRPSTLPQQTAGLPGGLQTTHTVPAASNGVDGFQRLDVTMSRSGTATVTLRWPNGDVSLQLYVTSATCADTASLAAGACAVMGNTRPGDLPGVVTSPVTGGDQTAIWVLNSDRFPQGFSVVVEIR
jgi:hypothetical protein